MRGADLPSTPLCSHLGWEELVEDFRRALLAPRESRSRLLNLNVIQKHKATPVPMDGSASHGKLVFMSPRPSIRHNGVMSFLNTRSVETVHENLWLAVGPGRVSDERLPLKSCELLVRG